MSTDTQGKIGGALLKNLITLREQKGEIKIEDVGAILEGMASSLNHDSTEFTFLRNEIEKMAKYIASAKAEISELLPGEDEDEEEGGDPPSIGHASIQLDAVVKATEEATNTILDATDEIQEHMNSDKDDAKAKMTDACNRIYEATSFQDITGQRITKVLKTLEYIEGKVYSLMKLFSEEGADLPELVDSDNRSKEEKALLKGPALPDTAPDQEEIDALFASLK